MAVLLSPVGGVAGQFFDNNGDPLVGGKLFTYAAGTTTPQVTFTSALGVTPNSNPIILNGGGRVPSEIWLTDGLQYKFVLYSSTDQLIGSWDNIVGINSNFVNFVTSEEVQTATAGQTVFTLTTMAYQPGTNNLVVYVDGVNQIQGGTFSFVETSSTVVTFTTGLHLGAVVKFVSAETLTGAATSANLVSYTPAGSGAVATNVQTKLRETVSVKDFGAVGDGVADDTAAIQAAVDAVVAAGGGVVNLGAGTFKITSPITLQSDVVLRGAGKHQTVLAEGALTFLVQAVGALSGTSHTLASNANADTRTIVLSSGGASYAVGDYALLQAENLPFAGPAATAKQAEYVRIETIVGNTLTVRGNLAFTYTTANTAKLSKLLPVRDVIIEDLAMTSLDTVNFARLFSYFDYCQNLVVKNCHFFNGKSSALYFRGCVDCIVESCSAKDLQSDPVTAGAFGYFVVEAGPNINFLMMGCTAESVRHTYTTVLGDGGGGVVTAQPYGYPMYSKIQGCRDTWSYNAGFDTHPGAGYGIEFSDCTVYKSNRLGFQIRSENTLVKSCYVFGAVAPAVYTTNYGNYCNVFDVYAEDTNTGTDTGGADWTSSGAYLDNSIGTIWRDIVVRRSGGPAFELLTASGLMACEVSKLRAFDPCRVTTIAKSGMLFTGTGAGTVRIDDPYITCRDTRMDYGINSPNPNPRMAISGAYITGSQVALFNLNNVLSIVSASKNGAAINNFGSGETTIIASGVADITNLLSSYLVLNGEGGLSDDLDTITGGRNGDMIFIRAIPTITIKHNVGNILLAGNVDFAMGGFFNALVLVKIDATWVEVGRR
jgi:hypothetical protein